MQGLQYSEYILFDNILQRYHSNNIHKSKINLEFNYGVIRQILFNILFSLNFRSNYYILEDSN